MRNLFVESWADQINSQRCLFESMGSKMESKVIGSWKEFVDKCKKEYQHYSSFPVKFQFSTEHDHSWGTPMFFYGVTPNGIEFRKSGKEVKVQEFIREVEKVMRTEHLEDQPIQAIDTEERKSHPISEVGMETVQYYRDEWDNFPVIYVDATEEPVPMSPEELKDLEQKHLDDIDRKMHYLESDEEISEASNTSINGAVINRKLSPAIFKDQIWSALNMGCTIVDKGYIGMAFKSKGFKPEMFPDGDIALLKYKTVKADLSKRAMGFFNQVCGQDLGKEFTVPGQDYLVLGSQSMPSKYGRPEEYTWIAIPLDGQVNLSDDAKAQASMSKALGGGAQNEQKKYEQIIVTSFNKMLTPPLKSYHLMSYQKNSQKRDQLLIFFMCDKLPPNDNLVKEDIVGLLSRIVGENTQLEGIRDKIGEVTSDMITRYGDVDSQKYGPKTIFYVFLNYK